MEDEVGKEYSTHGEKRNSYSILVGRIRYRGEDNFKVDFKCIGWGGMDSIDLA
jgi:hypothetical protein